jgi:hypothetical protein
MREEGWSSLELVILLKAKEATRLRPVAATNTKLLVKVPEHHQQRARFGAAEQALGAANRRQASIPGQNGLPWRFWPPWQSDTEHEWRVALQEPMAGRVARSFDSIGGIDLAEDIADVAGRGVRADDQLIGDVAIALARGKDTQHVDLTLR